MININKNDNISLEEVLSTDALYYFYGDGCPHCMKVDLVLTKFKYEVMYNLDVIKINSKKNIELNRWKRGLDYKGVPTLLLVKDGEILKELTKLSLDELTNSAIELR